MLHKNFNKLTLSPFECSTSFDALALALSMNAQITTISLLHAFAATFLLQYYTPTMSEAAPVWTYLVASACMFLYQTLDAIDGKQARRTGSSSPLGQLFDHGCDAVCAGLTGLILCSVVRTGASVQSMIILFLSIVPFFVSNWEESSTGMMRFGIVGVTEGQLTIMVVIAASGLLGPEIWQYKVMGKMRVKYLFMCVGLAGDSYQCLSSIKNVFDYYGRAAKGKLRDDESAPTTSFSDAMAQLLQYIVFIALSTAYVVLPSSPYIANPRTVLMLISVLFAYQVSKLIICHVTHDKYDRVFTILMPLPLLVAYEGVRTYYPSIALPVDNVTLLHAYLGVSLAVYTHYLYGVVTEITTALNIKCFTIPHKQVKH